MDEKTALTILERVRGRRKQADVTTDAFAGAVDRASNSSLKADAARDVRNLFLLSLGGGMAARGGIGLLNLFGQQKPKKLRTGPAMLPLPYPVPPGQAKLGGFLSGDSASTRWGIPAYGPAMLASGVAGGALGWAGVDSILDARRRRASEESVENARAEFQDALLGQYAPLEQQRKKAAADTTMQQVGAGLDRLFDRFEECFEKAAFDIPNALGGAAGLYGMGAGTAALLTGAVAYDYGRKNSRRAIIEKALKQRQRRNFAQQPTEIYAVPEPVTSLPRIGPREEKELLANPPA